MIACAPLAWVFLPTLATFAFWVVSAHDHYQGKFYFDLTPFPISLLLFGVLPFFLLYYANTLVIFYKTPPPSFPRCLLAVFVIPLGWIMAGVMALVILPGAAGFVRIAITSLFR